MQGQIDTITGVINVTKHNPLDKPLNRTYANNLIQLNSKMKYIRPRTFFRIFSWRIQL